MKKLLFLLTLLICATDLLYAQDFWQQLTPIPIVSNSTRVQCLATNSKGHIFAGVDSYPTDGVFRSIDEGQSWEKVLTVSDPPSQIKIDANDVIYLGKYYPSVTVSKDDGNTWNDEVHFPEVSYVTMLYTGGQDTIYVGGDSNNGALFLRSYDGATTWDTMVYIHPFPAPDEGANTTERVSSMVITSDGVFYIGVYGYIHPDYVGGLYRSYDRGDTWERVAPEVWFIEHMAINSKDDIFMACANVGTWVLRSGATTAEYITALEYIPYDIVVDHADYIYTISYIGTQCSYDDGITFKRIQNTPIGGLYTGKDNYLYGYGSNKIYRSTLPILEIDQKKMKTIDFFPNPATDYITVQLPDDMDSVVLIYDLLGKKILKTTAKTIETINISNFQKGIYILRVETSTEVLTSKFIKN